MFSLILQAATRYLQPLLLLFSVYLLVVGHNEPGGGFAGGLVAASAVALEAVARDVESARRLLPLDAHALTALGLLCAAGSGVFGLARGEPFMKGEWTQISVAGLGEVKLGTPLLFDAGVYLVVLGVAVMIILVLAEE